MKFIIAKKVAMTQRFQEDGTVVPVTILKAEPCTVTQVRTEEKDGYTAVQIATDETKKVAKPQAGHTKAIGKMFATTREFRLDDVAGFEVGAAVKADQFKPGEYVKATGTSKGKGFQGVVKRHGFAGGKKTHGNKDQLRMPGSLGAKGPARVFKGTRMGGNMGNARVTVSNLRIVDVDMSKNEIAVSGAVPGHRGTVILLHGGTEKRTSWN